MARTHATGDSGSAWGAGTVFGLVIGLILAALIVYLVIARPWAGSDGEIDVNINQPDATQQSGGAGAPAGNPAGSGERPAATAPAGSGAPAATPARP